MNVWRNGTTWAPMSVLWYVVDMVKVFIYQLQLMKAACTDCTPFTIILGDFNLDWSRRILGLTEWSRQPWSSITMTSRPNYDPSFIFTVKYTVLHDPNIFKFSTSISTKTRIPCLILKIGLYQFCFYPFMRCTIRQDILQLCLQL